MKILLLGKDGQVGRTLCRALAPLGELLALGRRPQPQGHVDLSDLASLSRLVREVNPDVIVNAAAFTTVDQAEREPDLAFRINAEAPEILARAMRERQGWLVHYSSEYVYDGSGSEFRTEDSPTAPLNVYGLSKRAGDEAICRSGAHHLLLRTSWVYGSRGEGFPQTVLRLAAASGTLRMVDDQVGAPTGADLLADVSALALWQACRRPAVSGLYHVAAAGAVSRADYARHVLNQARLACATAPIASVDYPTPAQRPLNSRLDCTRLQRVFGLRLPDWRDGLDRALASMRVN
ncbi:dTDP-4-dehydrorhamnose reductase [Bordetella avium]|uniref:dTDP-4-dehydrorhamnose reductase n=1 Tax=Bordetella avium TaxID=521 RepID=UPI000E680B8C|nr:dTDP-4-dehydrorhamnose reductase [Bordetella avium]RIQ72261.1 dTDP-4-dehydrorhamnose reductase [Bordetella avium]